MSTFFVFSPYIFTPSHLFLPAKELYLSLPFTTISKYTAYICDHNSFIVSIVCFTINVPYVFYYYLLEYTPRRWVKTSDRFEPHFIKTGSFEPLLTIYYNNSCLNNIWSCFIFFAFFGVATYMDNIAPCKDRLSSI